MVQEFITYRDFTTDLTSWEHHVQQITQSAFVYVFLVNTSLEMENNPNALSMLKSLPRRDLEPQIVKTELNLCTLL